MALTERPTQPSIIPASAMRFLTIPLALILLAVPLGAQSDAPLQPPLLAPQSGVISPALTPEELGDLHMARRRYQAAIQTYHQMPHISPAVWNKIGMANQQMFILEEAKKSYENALKMDPRNPDILNNMGTVYYSMKQFANAEKYYRKALKQSPKSALIYKNLGTDLMAEDKFKKGWDCYQAALAIDPEIFERSFQYRVGEPTPAQRRGAMNFYLAKSYVRAGMNDRAVDYLRMAIDEGFTDRKKVLADKEFASLRGIPSFEQLLVEQAHAQ
jgi:tetratricopeptide (TPR) repeat protein